MNAETHPRTPDMGVHLSLRELKAKLSPTAILLNCGRTREEFDRLQSQARVVETFNRGKGFD